MDDFDLKPLSRCTPLRATNSQYRFVAFLLASLLLSIGCERRDPSIPVVVYPDKAVIPEPSIIIKVPAYELDAAPAELNIPQVTPDEPMAFRGTLKSSPRTKFGGMFTVVFERPNPGGKGNEIGNLLSVEAIPEGDDYRYSLELAAPVKRGNWSIKILRIVGVEKMQHLVATGNSAFIHDGQHERSGRTSELFSSGVIGLHWLLSLLLGRVRRPGFEPFGTPQVVGRSGQTSRHN